jgi:hypothetical protein
MSPDWLDYRRLSPVANHASIDVKPLINRTFEFRESIDAFNFALHMPPDCVKAQIQLAGK